MKAWQKRVEKERAELQAKLDRLETYVRSDKFDELEQTDATLLIQQAAAMGTYLNVLRIRILRFK